MKIDKISQSGLTGALNAGRCAKISNMQQPEICLEEISKDSVFELVIKLAASIFNFSNVKERAQRS